MTTETSCNLQKNKPRTFEIARLNDAFRRSLVGGQVLVTNGVLSLGHAEVDNVIDAVRRFSDFSAGNDPYGEHDFGMVTCEGQEIFWKIDYYDAQLEFGSPNPADPSVTTRVLTIMLASEY